MKKPLIATALLFTALPFTFDGVTPAVSKAHAIRKRSPRLGRQRGPRLGRRLGLESSSLQRSPRLGRQRSPRLGRRLGLESSSLQFSPRLGRRLGRLGESSVGVVIDKRAAF